MKQLALLWRNKTIRRKILVTLLILGFFRMLAAIPLPAIPINALRDLFQGNPIIQTVSLVSGGLIESASLLAIGLGPYISASYVFQLLSMIVPQIKELYEGGPQERQVLSMYTRLLTLPLAIIQSFVIYNLLTQANLIANLDQISVVAVIAMLTFGAYVTMWFGELISEYGVSNGSSIIISAGILVSIPGSLRATFDVIVNRQEIILIVGLLLLMLIISVVLYLAERRTPIQYARRVRASGSGGLQNYIPIKLNPAGVMPVIFAVSFVSFPQLIVQYLSTQTRFGGLQQWAVEALPVVTNQRFYDITLLVALIVFAFFSAFLVFKPADVAKNLSKQSAFIPGVRPGFSTEQFLRRVLMQCLIIGAVLLAVLAILPTTVTQTLKLPNLVISGTGILIISSVMLELVRQIRSLQIVEVSHKRYY